MERINAYTIFARTAEDKAIWMEAFKEAFAYAHLGEEHGHDLSLTTFEKPTNCDVCFRLLKGLFYQGSKCKKCSRSIHQGCVEGLPPCGNLLIPPSLPPRPSSMQLPIVQNGDSLEDEDKDSADELQNSRSSLVGSSLHRQGSDTSNGSLVMAPPLSNQSQFYPPSGIPSGLVQNSSYSR